MQETLGQDILVLLHKRLEWNNDADGAFRKDLVFVERDEVSELLFVLFLLLVPPDYEAELSKQGSHEEDFFVVFPARPLIASPELFEISQVEEDQLPD